HSHTPGRYAGAATRRPHGGSPRSHQRCRAGSASRSCRDECSWSFLRLRSRWCGGTQCKPDMERCAVLVGVECQRAPMALLDDPPSGVKAEPGAVPDVLGSEERIEHVRTILG